MAELIQSSIKLNRKRVQEASHEEPPIILFGGREMQVATILPTAYLELTENNPYHMALAHLVGRDRVYTEFFTRMSNEGKFVMLDNGVIEAGVPMNIKDIVTKSKLIGASEVILPDTLDDAEATLNAACEAIPYARKYYAGRLMGVPQGKTLDDWVDCAKAMLELDVDTIGIPKRLVSIGGRDARYDVLGRLGWLLRGREVHLLGCWETPIECSLIEKASKAKQIVPVRGVDSCIPYVYAREDMYISQGPRPSGAVDFSAKDAVMGKLLHNIEMWEAACTLDNKGMYQIC